MDERRQRQKSYSREDCRCTGQRCFAEMKRGELMSNVYSLRIYDTELMRFSMEKQGLAGLVAKILYVNAEQAHLLPLDMSKQGKVSSIGLSGGSFQKTEPLWMKS